MNVRGSLDIRYIGNVQGVGFRFTVRHIADIYEIVGFVRNEPDGSVFVHAEGGRESLESFMREIECSPVAGYIRDIKVEEADITDGKYSQFSIEH